MTEKERALSAILSRIADEINITQTMQEKAVCSYEAVGKWIGDGVDYDVKIMPQGSMNLGTVIKPLDDRDDYDMDLVCLLKNGQYLSLSQIKNLVGDRLKEHGTYRSKLDKESKRCWTMQYEEFHMDILPCVPKESYFIEPYLTKIKLTHKNEAGVYEPRYSDPYAYHTWFENRMTDILLEEKRTFAAKSRTEINEVPTYKMRTPLQKTIQLLKRHRDICFQNATSNSPISIIITTLAALAYDGETNVYEALYNIIEKMPRYIECRDGVYWIENPVMKEENFADKWSAEPAKRTSFFTWLAQVKKDLITDPICAFGIDRIADQYKTSLGKSSVERAIRAIGYETKSMRQNGSLYVNGLVGGLTTSATSGSKLVKEHTFFGE